LTFRFDVIYDNLDINNFRQPNIVINHIILIKSDQNDRSLYVKINSIDYKLEIHERLIENLQDIPLIKLDDVMIYESSFLELDYTNQHYMTTRSVMFEIPSQEFNKIINSRMRRNKIVLSLQCKIKYEIYKYQDGNFLLKKINKFDNKFMHQNQNSNRIILSDEESSTLIKDNEFLLIHL
jgi:hypothetical protein